MFTEINSWAVIAGFPALAALFRMLVRIRKEIDDDILQIKNTHEHDNSSVREALAEFKLHVARNYVSVNYLKDVESRLTNHLLRIEKKLDDVGRSNER